jgi:hypothetical protein
VSTTPIGFGRHKAGAFSSRGEEKMFGRFKLTGKIVLTVLGTLLVTSTISFWITQRQVNQQQEEAFRDRLRQITGMASTTRAWFSDNIDQMVPDHNFKHLTQVPSWWPGTSLKSMLTPMT